MTGLSALRIESQLKFKVFLERLPGNLIGFCKSTTSLSIFYQPVYELVTFLHKPMQFQWMFFSQLCQKV